MQDTAHQSDGPDIQEAARIIELIALENPHFTPDECVLAFFAMVETADRQDEARAAGASDEEVAAIRDDFGDIAEEVLDQCRAEGVTLECRRFTSIVVRGADGIDCRDIERAERQKLTSAARKSLATPRAPTARLPRRYAAAMASNDGESISGPWQGFEALVAEYAARGLSMIDFALRTKAPRTPGWPDKGVKDADQALRIFGSGKRNIGIVLGERSGGVIDVDLDCPEALARTHLLPNTSSVFGRVSTPRSHFVYKCDEYAPTIKFVDPFLSADDATIIEVRGDGGVQTVFPPSIHPSGEIIEWDNFGDFSHQSYDEIVRAARAIAVEVVVERHGQQALEHPKVQEWLCDQQGTVTLKPTKSTPKDNTSSFSYERSNGDSSHNERAYALKALEENARELAACGKGGRNDLLNKKAFRMGRMGTRGWVTRSEVENVFIQAMRVNGYINEHGLPATRATFNSGWTKGLKDPHDDLPPRDREPECVPLSPEAIQRAFAKSAADRARFEEYKRIDDALSRGAALEQQEDGSITDAESGEIIVDGVDMRPGEPPSDRLARKVKEWREWIEGDVRNDAGQAKGARSEKIVELETINAADLAGKPVPPMCWHVDNMIPEHNVTLLSGDGATGKSLLALQLAVATATGGDWIGFQPRVGRVVYLSAEDELDELHRRLANIVPDLSKLSYLTLVPMAGKDAVLAAPSGKDGLLQPTEVYKALRTVVDRHQADLVILDTLADLFGGDEIKKIQARGFIGMLRGMALDLDCTIVLLSHPSQNGMSSGDGTSGNVAWNNSVRSRLYFERRLTRDGGRTIEDDQDIRILSVKKNNRAPNGGQIVVRYDRGQFVREKGIDLNAPDIAREVERVFLELLDQFESQGRDVSPNPSQTYAPALFDRHPNAGGHTKRSFQKAMDRLLEAGRIKIVTVGPPSKQRRKLVIARTAEDESSTFQEHVSDDLGGLGNDL